MASSAVQLQSEKVKALKAAHAPQLEVTAAIEELKRLKCEDAKSAAVPAAASSSKAADPADAGGNTAISKESKSEGGKATPEATKTFKPASVDSTASTAATPNVSSNTAVQSKKELKHQSNDSNSKTSSSNSKGQSGTTPLTLEAAAEKIRTLKQSHASQAAVSQAVAEYITLKSSHSLDPVAVAAARIQALKEANASQELVITAIDEYKKATAKQAADAASPAFPLASAPTPVAPPAQERKTSYRPLPSHPEPLQPACSIEAISQRVKKLKATGAPQDQVAAAVAELSAFRTQGSLDLQTVAEEKVRTLKNALAPQALVQGAVDELTKLKVNATAAKSELVKLPTDKAKASATVEKPAAQATKEQKHATKEQKHATKEAQKQSTSAININNTNNTSNQKSEPKESNASSSQVRIWESENFDDFQARIGARPNQNKKCVVSETGISPPITSSAATAATITVAASASGSHAPQNLSSAQEQSEKAEQRISELSTLCDKHFKLNADAAELQRLRAESASLLARNASLRKSLQEKQGGAPHTSKLAPSSGGNTQKVPQSKPAVAVASTGATKASSGDEKAFLAWQKSLSDKCAKLAAPRDATGWPGEYWIEEAKKGILAVSKRADLDALSSDPTTGPGRAAQFILKQFPLP